MAYKHLSLWIYAAFVSDCLVRKPSHGRVACLYLTQKNPKTASLLFLFFTKTTSGAYTAVQINDAARR